MLAVADGSNYTNAARAGGRQSTVMTGKVLVTGEHRIMALHTVWPKALTRVVGTCPVELNDTVAA